ncbi:adenylate/guanylate cyclase domain-containing protein [Nocardioides KLBMP 9356]|uniref:Adenylate/guanylate cyclase domain-containing protein n=1 Tax=Nocardioides potassii TaxID=2911371 RepID=A0ABS9HDF4_9ACTN|nr:adenylate/guanylate cyclase domain-containing protein [Nocardioides potassii]MCF6379207.1 adenylate/guanylate cyclase domain-containing protein [Nocardioides potassii]
MARRWRTRAPYGSWVLGRPGQSPRAVRIRVQLLLTGLLLATNLVGAAVVVVIATVVLPLPPASNQMIVATAVAVPVYVAVAILLGTWIGTASSLRALRWQYDDEPPDARAVRRTLRVPVRLTVLQFALWATATVLFTVLASILQPERALGVGLTVGTASIVVSGIAFLLSDFALRPLAARALAGAELSRRPSLVGVKARSVIFWVVGTAAPVVALMVAGVVALVDDSVTVTRLGVTTIVVGAVVLVFGLLVTVLSAGAVVDPVLAVRDALLDVERGRLDREVVVFDGTEVGLLQVGFNRMATGLREREQLRDLFGRHVGREVAQRAAETAGEVELGGESRTASVLFVDLEGSTTYATEHDPAEVVWVLNRFFAVIVEEVDRRGGLVNKFMGDAVLAVFGAPVPVDDHAGRALGAARAIASRLASDVPELSAGVGVATGEVVAGNVGHEERFEYTVIGDAVNSASRLTDLAKKEDGRVLASRASVEAADTEEAERWVDHGSVTLRGRGGETEFAVPRP